MSKRLPYEPIAVTGEDSFYIIAIRYHGLLGSGSISASGAVLTLKVGTGIPNATTVLTMDTSTASYDTWGEVVDAINALADWSAILVGVRRSTPTRVGGANSWVTIAAETECRVPVDKESWNSAYWGGFALSNDRSVSLMFGFMVGNAHTQGGHDGARVNILDRVEFMHSTTLSPTGFIYAINHRDKTERVIWGNPQNTGTLGDMSASGTPIRWGSMVTGVGSFGTDGLYGDVGESILLIVTNIDGANSPNYAQWQGFYEPRPMGTKRTYKTTLADA